MTFAVGQKVVYPNHGVGVVEKISSAKFADIDQELYYLRLLSNNSKVMVPKDNLDLVGLRPLGNSEHIKALFEILGNGNIDTYKDWKGRYKQNLDKMKTGQLPEVAEVLKNLCLVSQKKSLSFREKKMFERAKYFIVSEIAHVMEVEEEYAASQVEHSLEVSLSKRKELLERLAAESLEAENMAAVENEDLESKLDDAESLAEEPAAEEPAAEESAAEESAAEESAAEEPAAEEPAAEESAAEEPAVVLAS